MKKLLLLLLCSFLYLNAQTIEVYGATATKATLEELKKEFLKDRKDDEIIYHIGSSGKGYAQYTNGMKFDMFFSADRKYAQSIYEDEKSKNEPKVYSYGLLTLYTLNEALLKNDLSSLMDKSVKKISIANPKLAPYGVAAMELIEKTPFANEIKEKLVLADNVAQATHFVDTGAAEIGLIPYALLKNNTAISGKFILLDDTLYTPLEHCFIVTKYAENKKLVQEFNDFVLSKKGKSIIEKHGFKTN